MLYAILLARPSKLDQANHLKAFVTNNFNISQPVHVRWGGRGLRFPDLVAATQLQLNYRLQQDGIPFTYPLINDLPDLFLPVTTTTTPSAVEALVTGHEEDDTETSDPLYSVFNNEEPSEFSVELVIYKELAIWLDTHNFKATMTFDMAHVHSNDLPFYLTQTLYDHLLAPDIRMAGNMKSWKFEYYRPHLHLNFVAAEERNDSPASVTKELVLYAKFIASLMAPIANISTSFHVWDVTGAKMPPNLSQNTSDILTFVYLTSLKGIVNQIQGIQLHHLEPSKNKEVLTSDEQGTRFIPPYTEFDANVFNVTGFVRGATHSIEQRYGISEGDSNNVRLKAHFAAKHICIKGIIASLDLLINVGNFDEDLFNALCQLVDEILAESLHNWKDHLSRVHTIYQRIRK